MEIVKSTKIPLGNGHYAPCIIHAGLVYISGQLPINASNKIPENTEDQTYVCLQKTDLILREAGSTNSNAIQLRIYIPDVSLWDKVNERHSFFFGDHKPVQCIVPTNTLHYGSLIEIEATAALNAEA